MKIQKNNWGWGREGEGEGLVGQGGCDRRIEKFLGKFTQKKIQGGGGGRFGGGGGVRVDVNEELKFLCKFKKKKKLGGGGGQGGGGGGVGGGQGG